MKSLRKLAQELGVSASYLCQVRNGKKKPSQDLLAKLPIEVLIKHKVLTKQVNSSPATMLIYPERKVYNSRRIAEVAQLVEQRTENELPRFKSLTTPEQLLTKFLESRREGLSHRTIEFYQCYLSKSKQVIGLSVTGQHIIFFLKHLKCSPGGKHAYFRALKSLYNWLYSPKSGYNLNVQNNPISIVDAPKLPRRILPSLSPQQIDYLLEQANCLRDKAIISLFADSGLRLTELASIEPYNIDWENRLIKVICKGNKEGLAPFGKRTEALLKQWLSTYKGNTLWDVNSYGISIMLQRLKQRTQLPCNPHTFRRTFASILAKRGVDSLHIKRLGRWESIAMVERYTRSVRFEDSLKLYTDIVN